MRKGNHGNGQNKGDTAEVHQRLAAHPVCQHAGKKRGKDAAQHHGRDNDGKLGRGALEGGRQIGQRAADKTNVHAEEQAAQPGNHKKKKIVAALGGKGRNVRIGDNFSFGGHAMSPLAQFMLSLGLRDRDWPEN